MKNMSSKTSHPVAVLGTSVLQENAGVCALIDGVQVAIFYLPAEDPPLYALGNCDPIGGANVMSRGIIGDLGGELVVADVAVRDGTPRHDPLRLASTFSEVLGV